MAAMILKTSPSEIHSNFDLMVENMGFSPSQVEDYATKFFHHMKSSEAESFLSHLRNHSDLFAMAHIPIQLQILCALWHKGETEFPKTLTAMMSKIVEHLFEWEESKKNEKTPVSQKRILYRALGQMALKGLERRQLIFSKAVVEDVMANFSNLRAQDLIGTGLVKGCGHEGEMYFIHLSYQEYVIARSISELPEEKQKLFVQEYKYQPHFQLVIRLLAGSLWEKTQNLKTLELFFDWLSAEPVDLLGAYQTELILACLEECQSPQLEEVVWKKYQIADFVERLFSQKEKPKVVVRYMAISQKVFLQLLKKVQETHRKNDTYWFLWRFSKFLKFGDLENVLELLKTTLTDQDYEVRSAAAGAVGRMATQVKDGQLDVLLAWLKTALADQHWEVRWAAAEAVGRMATQVKDGQLDVLLAWIKTALTDQDSQVREAAVEVIGKIVAQVKDAQLDLPLAWLKSALLDKDPNVRIKAFQVIGKVATELQQQNFVTLLEEFKTGLADDDWRVCSQAAWATLKIAPHIKEKSVVLNR